ncbi:hypothetical protein [Chamaesiphon minutus]|uniref:hypothetical protein n=1 Tax=Chamaesiphon minutus TaxID=1173032 RepID=UPI0002E2A9C0|nr:hypothetical protein [Chamaesiphon minutus]
MKFVYPAVIYTVDRNKWLKTYLDRFDILDCQGIANGDSLASIDYLNQVATYRMPTTSSRS